MFEQIFHESDIGADTANSKFAQRPIHPRNCLPLVSAPKR
jgi:hypothetical protein